MEHNKTHAIVGLFALLLLIGGGCANAYQSGDKQPEKEKFKVTISNDTDGPLSPSLFAVHTSDAAWNLIGNLSPKELEPLAEYGHNKDFKTFVKAREGNFHVRSIDAPIPPGQEAQFPVELTKKELKDAVLSGVLMYVPSNDAIAIADSLTFSETEQSHTITFFDNGTEENTELGSGFEGGQPDQSQGEKNVNNGTDTTPQVAIAPHTQLTSQTITINIAPVEKENKE